ncbi:DUF952 domain-containing protein [Hoeflea poritis]|uniref:DUF952 domain-containing protein n=1 Tax=Hoeflea poritis TaxID=2993659 RepID=A0ABT4VV44_9HYPH|nr:DUF952 domain-containing protein [Hoeflea poritis]MDA4848070.1 DUF952 domain-containing protein [Hoeflea poritis]
MAEIIYKIVPRTLWRQALENGRFDGAPIDLQDGYIHFSTARQVADTAALHFAGQDDLLLVAVDSADLGAALKYEPSRGGDLFPHLYGPLPVDLARWALPMPLGDDGMHQLPDLDR